MDCEVETEEPIERKIRGSNPHREMKPPLSERPPGLYFRETTVLRKQFRNLTPTNLLLKKRSAIHTSVGKQLPQQVKSNTYTLHTPEQSLSPQELGSF